VRSSSLERDLPLFLSSFFLPQPSRTDLIIGWTTSMKLFAISVIWPDLSRLGDFHGSFYRDYFAPP